MIKLRLTSRIVLIFVLFVAVLLALVGVLSYRRGSESLKAAAISEMLAVAIEKEGALDAWVDEREDDLEQLPTDLGEQAGMLIAAAPDSEEARSARALLMQDLMPHIGGTHAGFIELFVMEPRGGRVVASTSPAEEGKSKFGYAYFDNGKAGPYVEGPYHSAELGMPGMTASIPLRSADGRVVAVLAARLDLAAMNSMAQRRTGLRQTDDSFLFNAERVLVSQPRFLQENVMARRQIDSGAVRLCIAQKDGVILEPDYRGVPVIAAYRWIDKRQLGLIVKIDQAEALAPARAFGRSVLLISALALLATTALAFLLARTIRQGTSELAETNQALHAENAERKRAQEASRQSETRKSAIVESALDCIITMDAQGDITEFNPSAEETFGHQRSAVIGKKLAEVIVPPALRAGHLQKMEVYLATGESEARAIGKRVERTALRADGTEFPVEFAMSGATIQGERSITIFLRDITDRKRTEIRVEALHKELLDASRRAGMAEVATGVLHNVGNVLNSINVSTSIVVERLHKSRVSRLTEVVKLLADHAADLPGFLTLDERGRNLPEFLAQLAAHLNRETHEIAEEMQGVAGNVEHIKEIVSTQQSYAGSFGVLEPIDLRDSIEDALRIHGGALNRHGVEVVRELEPIAAVVVDKHKVLQILVNLISNAKYAMTDSAVKTLTIKTYPSSEGGIQISIHDTGCGIVAENITRIFAHGFTTKKEGHGFGLHSSALAAREMNALLIAHSDGVGHGAVFTLVFPPASPAQIAA